MEETEHILESLLCGGMAQKRSLQAEPTVLCRAGNGADGDVVLLRTGNGDFYPIIARSEVEVNDLLR